MSDSDSLMWSPTVFNFLQCQTIFTTVLQNYYSTTTLYNTDVNVVPSASMLSFSFVRFWVISFGEEENGRNFFAHRGLRFQWCICWSGAQWVHLGRVAFCVCSRSPVNPFWNAGIKLNMKRICGLQLRKYKTVVCVILSYFITVLCAQEYRQKNLLWADVHVGSCWKWLKYCRVLPWRYIFLWL